MAFNSGSPIKSVTRGVITIANTASSQTATIPAVNTAKTEVRYLGNDGAGNATTHDLLRVTLTNSTTLTANRNSTIGAANLSYEITEWM